MEHMDAGKGFVLILSAPSGAGKSTLARVLMERGQGMLTSVSTTTRSPRPGEQEGKAYFFVDEATFKERIAAGEFLEWAHVFGNHYGTSRGFVEDALHRGLVVMLDIDWQGARQVRDNMGGDDVVSVFIMPPSRDHLRSRLQSRGQDAQEVIERRMAAAAAEMSHWDEYDYIVNNDDLERAGEELAAIVKAERLRRSRVGRPLRGILETFGL
ncbi:MAG: guanylate kinase [Magnetococcales bacterium]|nr:guanylate kinase [Magnetococcales bacterium]